MSPKSPVKLLFTVDSIQNQATLQYTGEPDETFELQKKRMELLVETMNQGTMNPTLQELGLPSIPTQGHRVVILSEDDIDQESLALLANTSCLSAETVLMFEKQAIEV